MKYLILTSLLIFSGCQKAKKESTPFHALGVMGQTATKISSGSIILTGGIEHEVTKTDIMIYTNGNYEKISDLKVNRCAHTAALLPNGKILVVGGYENYGAENSVSAIEEIDPTTYESTIVAHLNIGRGGHSMTLLNDGRYLISGGVNGQPLNTAEIYDPITRQISVVVMNESRANFPAIKLASGEVLVLGGYGTNNSVVEKFDPQTDTFSRVGNLSYGRFVHIGVLLDNNKILIAGGYDGVDSLNEAELYDTQTNTSQAIQSMSVDRDGFGAHKLANGKVLVFGGADMGIKTTSVQIFDPATNQFQESTPLKYAVDSMEIVELGSQLVIFGGTEQADFFTYDLH